MITNATLKSRIVPVFVLSVVCLALFSNTFTNELVWDDPEIITENVYIRDCKNIFLFFTPHYWNELHPDPSLYRPLRTISFTLDHALWGLNPTGYHITNVLLHVANVLLVFYLTTIITKTRNAGSSAGRSAQKGFLSPAFLTALLFAAHPIHTESINFVKNRSDLMAFLFFFLSALLFIKSFSAAGRKSRGIRIVGAWLLFVPAVLSKEIALTLPGVLVLYAVCFLPRPDRRTALAWIVPYGLMILIFFWTIQTFIASVGPLPAGPPMPRGVGQHLLTVVKTTGIYFKLLVLPFPLSADRAFIVPTGVSSPAVLASLLAVLFLLIVAARTYRRAPIVCFAIGWILLTLVPVSNLVFLVSRPIAEQRLYLPSFGFCLLIGYGIERLACFGPQKGGRPWPILAGIALTVSIVALYAVATVQRNFQWRSNVAFCASTVAANPFSIRMRYNYGNALSDIGAYEEAIRQYQTALHMKSDYLEAHYNLGVTYYKIGHHDKAVHHYRAVLALEPDNIDALNNMGVAFYDSGRLKEALECFREVLRLSPDDVKAERNMKDVLADLDRLETSAEP